MEKNYGQKAPNILLLLGPGIISAISLIGIFITSFFTEDNKALAGPLIGLFIICFVSFGLMFVLSLVYYYKFGGIVEKIAGPQASRLLVFILFWFVSPAAVYIVQEKLNNLNVAQPAVQPQPPQPPAI